MFQFTMTMPMSARCVAPFIATILAQSLAPASSPDCSHPAGSLPTRDLLLRGAADTAPIVLYRHQSLSTSYCVERLRTYGESCGVAARPHQLRHTCATLLLNLAGQVSALKMMNALTLPPSL